MIDELLIALMVALLDGWVVYLQVKERDAWLEGNIWKAVWLEGLTSLAVGVTVIAFVSYTWWMLVPTTIGSMVGRWLAWRL